MPIDEAQKNSIVLGVTNVVRNFLSADTQRTSMAFRMLLENAEPPIPLQPFVDYLVNEQKVPEQQALELCCILRSREERLKVQFVPPQKLMFMPQEQQERVVRSYNARTDTTGAWEKKSAETSKPQPASPGWQPDKRQKGPPVNRQKQLLVALGVGALATIGFYTWRGVTKPPAAIEVKVDDAGLPCGGNVIVAEDIAICQVTQAWWTSTSPETAKAKADITKKSLVASGVKVLQVKVKETNKTVLMR